MKQFEIKSGKLVLSDPCYDLGTWCQGIVDGVKKGKWVGDVEYIDSFGHRVAKLWAYHEDYPMSGDDIKGYGEILEFTGGVDSGQFGYFDHEEYRNDNIVQGVERVTPDDVICDDEPWYSICCDRTLSKDKWGEIPFGIVSSSGYGDGSYPTYGIKDVDGKEWVGFVTLFIWDDDEEDDE